MIRMAPGSSPLARGLHVRDGDRKRLLGIIPARAGFTAVSAAYPASLTDHPRSRGVYCLSFLDGSSVTGSSPLARGLPH